jgi:hypothetical protein
VLVLRELVLRQDVALDHTVVDVSDRATAQLGFARGVARCGDLWELVTI